MYSSSAAAAAIALNRSPVAEVIEDSEPERVVLRREQRRKKREEKTRARNEEGLVSWANRGVPSFLDSRRPLETIRDIVDVQPPTAATPSPVEDVVEDEPPESPERGRQLNLGRFAYPSHTRSLSSASSSTFASVSTLPTTAITSRAPSVAPPIDPIMKPRRPPKTRVKKALPGIFDAYTEAQLLLITKCIACEESWTTQKTANGKALHMRKCANTKALEPSEIQARLNKALENAEVPPVKQRKGKGKQTVNLANGTLAVEPPRPATYLEDLVKVTAPKKRTKRKVVVGTVQPVSAAQEVILGNAQHLLENLVPQDTDKTGPQQNNNSMETDENSFPPPTQVFTTSSLAGAFRRPAGSAIGFDMDCDDLDKEPVPLTQNFAPSNLSSMYRPAVRSALSIFDQSDEEEQQMPISTPSRPLSDPHLPRKTSPIVISSDDESLSPKLHSSEHLDSPDSPQQLATTSTSTNTSSPLVNKLSSAIQALTYAVNSTSLEEPPDPVPNAMDDAAEHYAAIEDEWGDDGACLLWNDRPNAIDLEPREVRKQRMEDVIAFFDYDSSDTALKKMRKGSGKELGSNSEQEQIAEDVSDQEVIKSKSSTTKSGSKGRATKKAVTPKAKAKTATKTKATSKRGDDKLSGHELYKAFKNMILNNEELHLRILRYEPIGFDELLAEAEKNGIKTTSLKQKLKTFLDISCITCYGTYTERNR
ncbi:hypothetical protein FRC02_000302 [Tulasnella sp. 418]|nr:hypothetical protein FRC02_000302 [Tulasnella sp. 418]